MDMKTLITLICIFFLVSFAGDVLAEEMISVRLRNYIGNSSNLFLHIKGSYSTLGSAAKLKEGNHYSLTVKNGKLYLQCGKSKTQINNPFIVYPDVYDENHLLYMNGRPYMGAVEFHIEDKKYIRPVNQLLLEDYLKGVVPFEVFPNWNLEALKAQTLAARTYTITHKNAKIDDTIHYQVYGGYNQFDKTKQAVNETKGEIITFQDKPIIAFYSASNGGMTESDENVWGGKARPYFPIKQDPYDPIFPWTFTLNKTQIEWDEINWNDSNWWEGLEEMDDKITAAMKTWLNQNGYTGEIKILSVPFFAIDQHKNESQRSLQGSIQIEFMRRLIDGTILFEKVAFDHVPLKRIRPMIGGALFRSYLINSFQMNPFLYKVSGNGNGHGVGMSQWGANKMAEKGKSYKEIIEHYYPGTQVKVITSSSE